MYKKILLPLDGSQLSECALGHARGIARALGVCPSNRRLVGS